MRIIFLHLSLIISSFSWGQTERELLKTIQNEKNALTKFWRTIDLGELYLKTDFEKAATLRKNVLKTSKNFGNDAKIGALLFSIKYNNLVENYNQIYSDLMAIQPIQSSIKDKQILVKFYHYKAAYHLKVGQNGLVETYIVDAYKWSKQTNNYGLIAENHRLKAILLKEENKKESAINVMARSLQFARRSSDRILMAKCLNTQAQIYAYFGQYELSISKNFVALQVAREADAFPEIAQINREIGELQLIVNNFVEGNRFINQAIETSQKLNDIRGESLGNVLLAHFEIVSKRALKAIPYLRNCIKVFQSINDDAGLGKAHMEMGSAYKDLGQYNESVKHYNTSLVHFESAGNRLDIANVYYLVGTVFEKQGKYGVALNYLNKSIQKKQQFGFQGDIYLTYKSISEVYGKTGNLRKSYDFLQKYSTMADSAKTVEISGKIAEISELYRSEQREKLIAIQADSIETQRRAKQLSDSQLENATLRSRFQMYVILGILLSFIFGGIMVYNRMKQRKIIQLRKEAEMNQTLLRSQMNPHFVFNAMSVIQSYIYENDTKNSTKFLINFSKLMRLILENSSKEFIPLETEIDILNKYLETQKLRFGDRFVYEILNSEELDAVPVVIPPMITQPFIENAIEHGQLHTVPNGFIHIEISKEKDMLHLTITDNGVGRKGAEKNKKSKEHKSMAMKITQDRIDNLNYKYKTLGSLHIRDFDQTQESGTVVNILLPFKTKEDSDINLN